MLKQVLFGSVLLAATFATAQENYATWLRYRPLTVNTTSAGANVAAAVSGFPLLVRLDSTHADVFNHPNVAASLRFTNAAGTLRLPHTIDTWDSAGKKAAVWVRLDVPGNATTTIRMYWNKPGAVDMGSAASVFSASNGFLSAFHMGGDRTTPRPNAVAGRNPATPMNLPSGYTPRTGIIGAADTLGRTGGNGLNAEHFSFGPVSATDMPTSNLTMSMWIKASMGLAAYTHAMTIAGSGNDKQNNIYLGKIEWRGAGRFTFVAVESGNGAESGVTADSIYRGSWQLVHAVLDGGVRRIYNNGVQTGASADLPLPAIMDRPNALIGATLWPDPTFEAVYDEVRVSNVTRAPEWAKLEYETQKPGAVAVALGATVTQTPPTGPLTNFHYGNDTIMAVTNVAVTRAPSYEGALVDSFKVVSGSLPAGLAIEKSTGVISGTSTAPSAAGTVVVRTWGANGTDSISVSLRVSVTQGVENLRYITGNAATRDTLRFEVGTAKTVTPTLTGTAVKYSISGGTLPAGLAFDTLTGVISGTATATAGTNRTVTVNGALNSTTRNIRIEVVLGPSTVKYFPGDTLTATAGASFVAAPIVGGRALTKWSAVSVLPTGLRLDTLNGSISGSPVGAAAAANYTIRATGASDTVNKVIRLTVAAATADGDYKTAWSGHRRIKLNTSASGSNVTNTLVNVPVLVRFDSTQAPVFINGGTNGASLRFTKSNGTTRLPHEIDHWDATARKGAVWVLVDSVKGGTAAQEFQLHYGNATATTVSNANAVFTEANGFVSVFHMGGTNVSPRFNAVVGRNPAMPVNLAAGNMGGTGVIGAADTLAPGTANGPSTQHFAFGPLPMGTFPTGKVTMSMWYKQTAAITDFRHMMSLGSGAPNNNVWVGIPGNAALRIRTAEGTTERTLVDGAALTTPGSWLLVHATIDGPTATIFANGVQGGSGDIGHTIKDTIRTSAFIARALWNDPGAIGFFDEVRLANVARSADWAKLEFENQKATQTLVSIDTLSFPVSIVGLVNQNAGLSFQAMGQGILFQARTNESAQLRIALMDIHGRTIWTQNARAEAGVNRVSWNGLSSSGRALSSGVYTVRMTLIDAQGKKVSELNRTFPLTR